MRKRFEICVVRWAKASLVATQFHDRSQLGHRAGSSSVRPADGGCDLIGPIISFVLLFLCAEPARQLPRERLVLAEEAGVLEHLDTGRSRSVSNPKCLKPLRVSD
ncbi:hypothetical protein [Methylocella tundrae]|uniref:hypothetical protein n=1 Tax=Methylocella tundrae TaxID=227605 RepID=UPI00157ACDAB|nr:hypothetical protein [Methylocella tundrae]